MTPANARLLGITPLAAAATSCQRGRPVLYRTVHLLTSGHENDKLRKQHVANARQYDTAIFTLSSDRSTYWERPNKKKRKRLAGWKQQYLPIYQFYHAVEHFYFVSSV